MKYMERFISLVFALVIVLGLTISASAAAPETVKARFSPNITVKLNGEVQTMMDVNGNPVYPVTYSGTTYLPVRAVSNMLGVKVDWDGATQTVILEKTDGKTTAPTTGGKTPADAKPTEITVQINPNITVKYNGVIQAMTDVTGKPVYPMAYNGTTYLPIRAVSNMLGVKVDWDGATQTVLLKSDDNNRQGTATDPGTTTDQPSGTTWNQEFYDSLTPEQKKMYESEDDEGRAEMQMHIESSREREALGYQGNESTSAEAEAEAWSHITVEP